MQQYFSIDKINKHLKTCEELRLEFQEIIGRLDSVDKYVHITTLNQLMNYLTPFEKKAKSDNSAKSQQLSHTLKALEICLNMIYFSRFTMPVFEKMLEEAEYGNRLYLENMSIWVLNSMYAIQKYQKKSQVESEKKLKDICQDIADIVQKFVNNYFGEKATIDGDYFYLDVKESVFKNNKKDLTSIQIDPFYNAYRVHIEKK
jgi:hypothetical protein